MKAKISDYLDDLDALLIRAHPEHPEFSQRIANEYDDKCIRYAIPFRKAAKEAMKLIKAFNRYNKALSFQIKCKNFPCKSPECGECQDPDLRFAHDFKKLEEGWEE